MGRGSSENPQIQEATMKKGLTLPLLVLFVFGPRWVAAAVVQYNMEQLSQKSKLVVEGEVVELTSYYAPFLDLGEVMFTDVKIRVEKSIKGSPDGKEITIQVLGGQIGAAFQHCPDSPEYEKGEKVLVFLREYNGRLWNTGWQQGKYKLWQNGTVVGGKESLPIPRDVPLSTVEDQVRLYSAPQVPGVHELLPKPAGSSEKGGFR